MPVRPFRNLVCAACIAATLCSAPLVHAAPPPAPLSAGAVGSDVAPDMEDLWLTVIFAMHPAPRVPSQIPAQTYLTLRGQDGKDLDPSPTLMARLSESGHSLLAGGTGPAPDGNPRTTYILIGHPVRRADGDYDVGYSSMTGMFGGSWELRMHHNSYGWAVVSRQLHSAL
jgi:hypothetical protein